MGERVKSVSACRRAWRVGVAARVTGGVALLRDRRCTSGNFPLLITPPQPGCAVLQLRFP